jgi:hypothetical protein
MGCQIFFRFFFALQ